MKPIRTFASMLAIALTLLLALAACRPDELDAYNPNPTGKPGEAAGAFRLALSTTTGRPQFEEDGATSGASPHNAEAISKFSRLKGGVPRAAGGGSLTHSNAVAAQSPCGVEDPSVLRTAPLSGGAISYYCNAEAISILPPERGSTPLAGGGSLTHSNTTRSLPTPEKSTWTKDDCIYFTLQLLGGEDADGDDLPDTAYSPWDGRELTTPGNVTTQLFGVTGGEGGVTTVDNNGKETTGNFISVGTCRHYLVGIAQYDGTGWSITSLKAIAIGNSGYANGQLFAFKPLNAASLVLPDAVTTLVCTAQYAPAEAPHHYEAEAMDPNGGYGGPFPTGIPVWRSTCTLRLGGDGSGSGSGSSSGSSASASLPLDFGTWTPLCARLRINTLPGLMLDFQESQFSLFGGQPLEYTIRADSEDEVTTNLLSYDPATGLPALGRFDSSPDATTIKSLVPDATTGDLIFYVPLTTNGDAAGSNIPTSAAGKLTLRASGAVGAGAPNPLGLTDQLLQSAGLTTADAATPAAPIFKVSELKLTQPKGYWVDAATMPQYKLDAIYATDMSAPLPSVTEDGKTIYLISGVNGLQKFAHIVMGTKTDGSLGEGGSGADYSTNANLAACGRLMADIHLPQPATEDGSNWTPLGYYSYGYGTSYIGTFDGGGHTVFGLVINRPSMDEQSFFGYIGSSSAPATVKNLTVEGTVTGGDNTGGIVGGVSGSKSNPSLVENCVSRVKVTGTGDYVGGVTGGNSYCILRNCRNEGSVEGTGDCVGGVTGINSSSSTITACTNTGSVKGTGYKVGGVVGDNISSSTITACTNTGSVEGKSYNVGGVVGENTSSTITACYNTGSVEGSSTSNNIGGVAGSNNFSSTTTTCYWQTFGSGNRPDKGVGSSYSSTVTVTPIGPDAYTIDGTPSWLAPAGALAVPLDKLNAALETWNGNHTTDGKACPYRFVQNPAYPAALRAAEGKNYDTNVPPLLLKKVPAD